jgi:hypothetical protein
VLHQAIKKPLLTNAHREKRFAFATIHAEWTWMEKSTVLFTNEASSTCSRKRPGELFLDKCVVSAVKFQGGRIIILGAMIYRGLVFWRSWMETWIPKITITFWAIVLYHLLIYKSMKISFGTRYDGAPCNRAKIVKNMVNKINKERRRSRNATPIWPSNKN